MANEQTNQTKRITAIEAMGKEMAYLMTRRSMPWQKAMASQEQPVYIARPRDGANNARFLGPNAPIAVMFTGVMMQNQTSDPRFFTFNSAKKIDAHVMAGQHGQLARMAFFSKKDKDGNLLPPTEQHWVNCDEFYFRADQVRLAIPRVDENGEIMKVVALDKDGNMRLDSDGNKIMELATFDKALPVYAAKRRITPEQTLEVASMMLEQGIKETGVQLITDQTGTAEKAAGAYYANAEKTIHMPPETAFPDKAAYLATALRELAMAQIVMKDVAEISKMKEQGDKIYPRRAMNHFKAEVVSLNLAMDLGLPVDGLKRNDFAKELAAHFEKYPLNYMRAIREADLVTKEIKNRAQDKLNEIFQTKDKSGQTYDQKLEAQAEALKAKQREAFGEKRLKAYEKAFKEVFERGGELFREGQMKTAENRYKQFVYQKAFAYGLTSARPDNEEGWNKADKAFIMQYAQEHKYRASAVLEAGNAVQNHSPYMKITSEKNYGKDMAQDILKSAQYTELQQATEKTAEKTVAR